MKDEERDKSRKQSVLFMATHALLPSVSFLSVLSSLLSLVLLQIVFTHHSLQIIPPLLFLHRSDSHSASVHWRVYRSVRPHFISSMN